MARGILRGKRVLFGLCGFELGGAERQALHLAKWLQETEGCEVVVWGHHHNIPGPERVIEFCNRHNIVLEEHRFRWPCRKRDFVRDFRGLARGLRKLQPDIILPYTSWPNVGLNLAARFVPSAVCYWGQRDVVALRGSFAERLAIKRARRIICNASHEVEHLKEIFGGLIEPERVAVVHNGVELAPAERSRSQWRNQLQIDADAVVVVMLANFREDKGHALLLRAWQRVRRQNEALKAVLVLAGAKQRNFNNIRQLADELGIGDSIRFPGHVRDVTGLLRAADIGVLVSRAEGLPNALLESMAAGLPVVAPDIAGAREALGRKSRLFNPEVAESLAELVQTYCLDRSLRIKEGRINSEIIATNFSVGVMCRNMRGILAEDLAAIEA